MKTYEMLYVLDNEIEDERKDAIEQRFEDIVESFGGKVESVDKLGAKKLSYPIKFKTEGYYVVLTFTADSGVVNNELSRVSGLTAEVLRIMTTVK